jgi:NADH oxidase (H2O2-forming)
LKQKIVIIGCGAAGWSAAVAARKIDKKAQITMIEQGKYPLYERGGIPFVIQGDIPNFEALVNFPLKYYEFTKIQLQTEAKVIDIDSSSKEVIFENKQKKKTKLATIP